MTAADSSEVRRPSSGVCVGAPVLLLDGDLADQLHGSVGLLTRTAALLALARALKVGAEAPIRVTLRFRRGHLVLHQTREDYLDVVFQIFKWIHSETRLCLPHWNC